MKIGKVLDSLLYVGAPLLALILLGIGLVAWFAGHLVSPVRIGLYVVAPVGLAALLLLTVTVWRRYRWLIVANMAAASIALVAAETWLAYEELRINIAAYEITETQPAMHSVQVCPRQLAALGGLETPEGPILPLGGIGHRLVRVALADGTQADLKTDRFGFNNPDNVWAAGAIDVLVVGDSFAFGADVAPGLGFVDVVRENRPNTVNLGCGGNGPLSEFAALAEYGPVLKPKFVVWSYYEGNDLTKDILDEMSAPPLRAYFDDAAQARQGLMDKQDVIDRALEKFLAHASEKTGPSGSKPSLRWQDIALFRNLRTRLGLTYGFRPQALADMAHIISESKALTEGWGGTLLFLYLPGEVRYRTPLGRLDANGYKHAVLQTLDRLGVKTIDVASDFDGRPSPAAMYAGHYTEEGYALVADIVLSTLSSESHE